MLVNLPVLMCVDLGWRGGQLGHRALVWDGVGLADGRVGLAEGRVGFCPGRVEL